MWNLKTKRIHKITRSNGFQGEMWEKWEGTGQRVQRLNNEIKITEI